MLNKKKIMIASFMISLLFFVDKLSKDLIVKYIDLNQSKIIIKDFFSLTYVRNEGAGFSILQGQFVLFYVITLIVFFYLIFLYFKETNKLLNTAYILIMGGAFGNFYDRLNYHYVIDFLHFEFMDNHFPIFNFADCFISLGVLIIIFVYIKEIKNDKRKVNS